MSSDLPISTRLPLDGQFQIDSSCIDCYLCQDLAPQNFRRNDDNDVHYVFKQPETNAELENIIDALETCPTASIHYVAAAARG